MSSWYPYRSSIVLDAEAMRFPDILKEIVIFLYVYDEERAKYAPIGTAFFVGLVSEDLFFPYLVTCRHVVEQHLNDGKIIHGRFNLAGDAGGVDYEAFPSEWVFHVDKTVDVAVLSWPQTNAKLPYRWAALPFDKAIFKSRDAQPEGRGIKEGDDVFFIGLFAQYTGNERNFPIVRFGKIALVTNEPIQTELGSSVNLILETQAYPGNSGSPLFIPTQTPDGTIVASLLGIIAGFWPDEQEVYVTGDKLITYTHFGISHATPATKISDVLFGEELMKKREKRKNSQHVNNMPIPAATQKAIKDGGITQQGFHSALKKAFKPDEEQTSDEGKSKT